MDKNTKLPNLYELINEMPEIVPSRLRVLVWIYDHCDNEGFVFESMRGIARKLDIAPQTVKLVFDLLIDKGLLEKKNREVYKLKALKASEDNERGTTN